MNWHPTYTFDDLIKEMVESELSKMNLNPSRSKARALILRTIFESKTGHLGGSCSIVDFLLVLYTAWVNKFSIVLSKGHASLALYAAIDLVSKSDHKILTNYGKGCIGNFHGHVSRKAHPSISLSAGSLGHGLPFAIGQAVACFNDGNKSWTVCILGDGEMQEGTTWESLLLLQKFRHTSRLLVVIDDNSSQESFDKKQVEFFTNSCISASINLFSRCIILTK